MFELSVKDPRLLGSSPSRPHISSNIRIAGFKNRKPLTLQVLAVETLSMEDDSRVIAAK